MRLTSSVWQFERTIDAGRAWAGYDVEASDGHIGKVDAASREAGRDYLVVDTGFWIFGKKRLIPAGFVQRVDDEHKRVFVAMTKDQIRHAPDFDDTQRGAYDNDYYDSVGHYYSGFGW